MSVRDDLFSLEFEDFGARISGTNNSSTCDNPSAVNGVVDFAAS